MKKTTIASLVIGAVLTGMALVSCGAPEAASGAAELPKEYKDDSATKHYLFNYKDTEPSTIGYFNDWDSKVQWDTCEDGTRDIYCGYFGWWQWQAVYAWYGIEDDYILNYDKLVVVQDTSLFSADSYGDIDGVVNFNDFDIWLKDYAVAKDGTKVTYEVPISILRNAKEKNFDTIAIRWHGTGYVEDVDPDYVLSDEELADQSLSFNYDGETLKKIAHARGHVKLYEVYLAAKDSIRKPKLKH